MFKLDSSARVAVIVMATVLVFGVLRYASELFAPMFLAFVIGIVMSPLSTFVSRAGLPPALTALGSLVLILILLIGLGFFIEPLVERASNAMPFIMAEVNSFVFEIRNSLRGLEQATAGVSEALTSSDGSDASGDGGTAVPTVEDALFMAPSIMAQFMIFAGTLFFFLLTRQEVYDFLARALSPASSRPEMAARLRRAEGQVAQYFLTIALINAGYAFVVSAVMAVIGMPSPVLWGVSAGLLNFVLYLGPAAFVAAALLGGLVVFDGAYSLLPAGAYLFLNLIESQFVTPTLVGRRLQTNPLAIFLSLVFFLWLWGAIGGIVAIPLLLWINAITSEARDAARLNAEQTSLEPESAPAR